MYFQNYKTRTARATNTRRRQPQPSFLFLLGQFFGQVNENASNYLCRNPSFKTHSGILNIGYRAFTNYHKMFINKSKSIILYAILKHSTW